MSSQKKNNKVQDIETLKKRYKTLHEKSIEVKTELNRSQQTLTDLKKDALEKFGTDDLDELKAKLEEMKSENEKRRTEYQKHLDDIEKRLKEVEQSHDSIK